ncbi:carbohydrate binding domain-containing protein [Pseudomonas sp. GB2N2]
MNKQASELQPPPTPELEVPERENLILDLTHFDHDPSVTTKQWPQPRLWLDVLGVDETGEELVVKLLEGDIATPEQLAKGFDELLPLDELKKFKNRSRIFVHAKITHNGNTDVSTARSFPTKELTIQTQPDLPDLDETTNFDNNSLNGWEKGPEHLVFHLHIAPSNVFCVSNTVKASTGVILKKTFAVTKGRSYEISVLAAAVQLEGQFMPDLTLHIGNQASPKQAVRASWNKYSFSAVATSDQTTFSIQSTTSNANKAQQFDDLRVRSLPH